MVCHANHFPLSPSNEMLTGRPLMVLFLSTGNAARSILAEALVRARGSHRFYARSAGSRPAAAVDQRTLALLQAEGIEVDGLQPRAGANFWPPRISLRST